GDAEAGVGHRFGCRRRELRHDLLEAPEVPAPEDTPGDGAHRAVPSLEQPQARARPPGVASQDHGSLTTPDRPTAGRLAGSAGPPLRGPRSRPRRADIPPPGWTATPRVWGWRPARRPPPCPSGGTAWCRRPWRRTGAARSRWRRSARRSPGS